MPVTNLAQQGFVVPKGVMHRTRAPERTVILMVENAGIMPTGNWSQAARLMQRAPAPRSILNLQPVGRAPNLHMVRRGQTPPNWEI